MEKTIKDFENYSINDLGQVFSFGKKTYKEPRFIKQSISSSTGYCSVSLCKNNKVHTKTIHRLVAESFLPNPDNLPQVNHKNGIKTDNRLVNLEWCTRSYNQLHSISIGTRSARGIKNSQCKLKESDILNIIEDKRSGLQISKEYGISQSTISDIRHGRSWNHISGLPNLRPTKCIC